MFILGIIILIIYFTVVPSVLGIWFGAYEVPNKQDMSFIEKYVWGFLILLGMFQAVIIPATFGKWTFNTIFLLFSVLTAALLVVSSIVLYKHDYMKRLIDFFRQNRILTWFKNQPYRAYIFFIGVAVVIICYVFFANITGSTFDDDTYIAIPVSTLENNGIYAENPTYGGEAEVSLKNAICGWHQFLAYLSKLSGIHPAILAHTVLPILLVIIAYMVYTLISRELFDSKKHQYNFLIGLALITLFGAYSWYTLTFRLNITIWQGKGLMAAVMLPFTFYYGVLAADKHKWNGRILIAFSVIMAAGFSTSYMAIGFIPIIVFAGTLISIRVKVRKSSQSNESDYDKKDNIFKILLVIIVLVISIALCGLFLFRDGGTIALTGTFHNIGAYYTKVTEAYLRYWNGSLIEYLFYAAVIGIGIIGIFDRKTRKVFAYCIVIAVLIFNPLTVVLTDSFLGGWDQFIRMYYMLFPEIIMVYACVKAISLFEEKAGKYSGLIYLVPALFITISGTFFNKLADLQPAENLYKLPQSVIDISDYLISIEDNSNNNEDKITLITPNGESVFFRQYTSKIKLVWGRWYVPGNLSTRVSAYYNTASKQGAYVMLHQSNVEDVELYEKSGATQLENIAGFKIYNKIHRIAEEKGYGEYYGSTIHRVFCPISTGWVRNWVNDDGNVVYKEYYDEDYQKTEATVGHFAEGYEYDEMGRIAAVKYYDEKGKACEDKSGVHQVVKKYDAQNNVASQSFYNLNGEKTALEAGQNREEYEYDSYNRRISISFFGLNDEPVLIWGNHCKTKIFYDDNNRIYRYEYYGVGEVPATETRGYFAEQYEFDELDRISKITIYNENNEKWLNIHGYCEVIRTYDAEGNMTEEHYDLEGNKV